MFQDQFVQVPDCCQAQSPGLTHKLYMIHIKKKRRKKNEGRERGTDGGRKE